MANNNSNALFAPAVLHILLALSARESHGYAFERIARNGGASCRVATGVAVAAAFVLFWMNAAVAGLMG